MLPLSSKYWALHAFKGKTHLMHIKLQVSRMSVYVATWPSTLVFLSTGVPAQDIAGEPEAESHGGGVLPETEVVRHGGKAGLRG